LKFILLACHVGHHGIQDPGIHRGRSLGVEVQRPDVVGIGLVREGTDPDLPDNPETSRHQTFRFASYHFTNLYSLEIQQKSKFENFNLKYDVG
jgi:hypothetical protein